MGDDTFGGRSTLVAYQQPLWVTAFLALFGAHPLTVFPAKESLWLVPLQKEKRYHFAPILYTPLVAGTKICVNGHGWNVDSNFGPLGALFHSHAFSSVMVWWTFVKQRGTIEMLDK